jgi:hypothetical protein
MRRPLLIFAAALVLSTSLPALAQTAPSTGGPPTRIANVYNWRHHQPTQQQVDAAKAAAGLSPPSLNAGQVGQVKNEVEALLKQSCSEGSADGCR